MITNEYSVSLQLANSGANSLPPDSYYESFNGYAPRSCHDYGVVNRALDDFLEPINTYASESLQTRENKTTDTFAVAERHYDLNVAFHMSPMMQLATMPPPPHNVYMNTYRNNNNATVKSSNKRGGWNNRSNGHVNVPQGYDSDESSKSKSSRDTALESDSIKHKISRSGYRLLNEHNPVYSNNNNNYRCNENLTEISNRATFAQQGYRKSRYQSNNGKRSRHDYNRRYSEDIIKRVHGLMERFTSRAKLYSISPTPVFSKLSQLDQSIWDLFSAKAQTQETYLHKIDLWKKLYLHITKLFDRYGLFMVGSTMSGLGTENSDIDMCLLLRSFTTDPRSDAVHFLEIIRNSLLNCDFIEAPEVIHAKVPILKFRGSQYGFEVDLNCNNAVGIRNTHLLHCYTLMDWRVRPLIIIVKLWAQANSINDAKNMTISSYSLALMVIHFLQCGVTPPVIPCLHGLYRDKFNPEKEIHDIDIQEELPKFYSDNKQTLGELLQGFLQYYAYFNYEIYAISVRLASRVLVDECRYARSQKNDPHQWKYLCIEEPFDLTNTARSVYDLPTFKRIQRVFQVSYDILRETENLSCILMNMNENQR